MPRTPWPSPSATRTPGRVFCRGPARPGPERVGSVTRVEVRRRSVLLFGVVALTALIATLTIVRVPDGAWAVRTWKGGGTPDLLGAGWALRFPGLQRLERFPAGEIRAAGR